MSSTKIFLADAESCAHTRDVVLSFRPWLDIENIAGSLAEASRNQAVRISRSEYVLFVDAGVEICDPTLVRRTVALARRKQLHCVTAAVACPEGRLHERLRYLGMNYMQRLSGLLRPFSSRFFMLFERAQFDVLGGFPEACVSDDGSLSRKIKRDRFGIVQGRVLTSQRNPRSHGSFRWISLLLSSKSGDSQTNAITASAE